MGRADDRSRLARVPATTVDQADVIAAQQTRDVLAQPRFDAGEVVGRVQRLHDDAFRRFGADDFARLREDFVASERENMSLKNAAPVWS